MDKEFSEGFLYDVADLLEACMENETDNIDLIFDCNGTKLKMDITFSILDKQNEE